MKRLFDICVALAGLIILSPMLIVLAAAIAINLGRPIFFLQLRAGHGGNLFRIVKFRSMRDLRMPDGTQLPDSKRLTGFGRLLRSTSLDELPGLWNVLVGDMSLVGPRPLLEEYLPRYTPLQARRHEVRPGITGWAQVNGRNSISWDQKLEYDVWYVDNHSMLLDLRILALTALKVVQRHGISASDDATMPVFMGSARAPDQEEQR